MVKSLAIYFNSQGYKVKLEVSNMEQSIDMVVQKPLETLVIAIEAKLNNWKCAIQQCKAHTLVCDYIVIALALKKVPLKLLSILNEKGWGLIMYNSINDSWKWEIKPQKNNNIWKPQRKKFLNKLQEIEYWKNESFLGN